MNSYLECSMGQGHGLRLLIGGANQLPRETISKPNPSPRVISNRSMSAMSPILQTGAHVLHEKLKGAADSVG